MRTTTTEPKTQRGLKASDREWRAVELAAQRRGVTPSAFARDAVIAAAKSVLDETEKEVERHVTT